MAMEGGVIPEATLVGDGGSMRGIPLLGMGTAAYPFMQDATKPAILHALELGYRHFDTASIYQSEQALGEAVAEAVRLGHIKSRAELFITSKLWSTDAHPDLVLPAIRNSLRNLEMDYLDLYLIHWPMSLKRGASPFPIKKEDVLPLDLRPVWAAMEECQRLGLAKAIGVSNFPTKKLQELLQYATIPPAVNQVEMNPIWQQKKLRDFCKEKGIHVTAYSPLGGQDSILSKNLVMESQVLQAIAKEKGKTVAQVALRWGYEQGVSMVVKSFNKERLKQNMEIFDWGLSEEDHFRISQIPQCKNICLAALLSVSPQQDSEITAAVDLSGVDSLEYD